MELVNIREEDRNAFKLMLEHACKEENKKKKVTQKNKMKKEE